MVKLLFEGVEKILVMKLRHIGDVLLSVPAIRALKETFPGSRVCALVNAGTEEMLSLNPLVDEVIPFVKKLKGEGILGRARREIGSVAGLKGRGFDMTVDLTGGDRAAITGYMTGARYRLGFYPRGGFKGKGRLYTHLAEWPEGHTHTVLLDLALLRKFGIDTGDLSVTIHPGPQDERFVEGLLKDNGLYGRPFVHIHPTSRWMFKCWTDEGMAGIMDRFYASGLPVVVTSGPDRRETDKVASILRLARSSPVDLSGRLRLKHLACVSRRSALFFGVDTAPMHIAAATGTPVAGIFGPSGAFDWGPWDNAAAALKGGPFPLPYPQRGGVQRFGRNTVIQKAWECVPCGRDGCNGTKKSDCLDSLTVDDVWAVVEEMLKGIKQGPKV